MLSPVGTETPSHVRFIAGGAASATAVFATYPLDLVQTKLAIQITDHKYRGITGTIMYIIKEEGFFQLYRGLGFTIVVCLSLIKIRV